jgi:hypothetical protein
MSTAIAPHAAHPYVAALLAGYEPPTGGLGWLSERRARALERANALAVPTTRDEEWRFTDITPLTRIGFRRAAGAATPGMDDIAPFTAPEAALRLVFVDGVHAPALSSTAGLPRGIAVANLAAALAAHGADMEPHLARHVAFDTDDLNGIASRLDRAAIPYVHALPGDFDASAIYTIDPAMNVVAFCQRSTGEPTDQAIQSLVHDWGWGIHHVNLEACDVREAAAFYVEIAGMTEGRWQAPAAAGRARVSGG